MYVRPFMVEMGGKMVLNFMKVGGVYGEEWIDVSGEGVIGKRN